MLQTSGALMNTAAMFVVAANAVVQAGTSTDAQKKLVAGVILGLIGTVRSSPF